MAKPTLVTIPYLPPIEEFHELLAGIWSRRWLTNNGPLHEQFERELAAYLGVPFVSLFNNGETALLAALRTVGGGTKIITTPFSFVGTAHAVSWSGLTPVFADVSSSGFNLDVEATRRAIGPDTAAILPVHCYGFPCDVDQFSALSHETGIPVIYDAAHAFGVKCNGRSVLLSGELSVLSFHATKVFNTFEGGAVVTRDRDTKALIDRIKNFGIVDEVSVSDVGINGKMSEFQAAMGILQLRYIDHIIKLRKDIHQHYHDLLSGFRGLVLPHPEPDTRHNYSYFPIRVTSEFHATRDDLFLELRTNNVLARRYFYPLITDFQMYTSVLPLPNARTRSAEVICLPIFPDLEMEEVERICRIIVGDHYIAS